MSTNDLSHWFQHHLQASADGLIWGIEQVLPERRELSPPDIGWLGEWTVARHLFHMVSYEEEIALPSMRQWLGHDMPVLDSYNEDRDWGGGHDLDGMLARFRAVRAEQIALLEQLDAEVWEEMRDCVWGPVSLRWVVSKTYQHTADHINSILQLALFWDRAAQSAAGTTSDPS